MIPIILKKSNVPSKAPTTADLDWGELAVNYTDGKLYYKKQSDNDPTGTIDYFTSSTAATGVNNGALTLASASGTTNTAVTINNGTGFTANSSQNIQYTIAVGPALTALSTVMSPNNTGLLKKTGTDTYTLDTTNYLTSAVTSVSGTGTVAGLSLSGTVTSTGNLTLSGTLSAPVTSINDSTVVGRNLVKLADPNNITFLRVNADNTVSALNAADFRTAIGAGTGGGGTGTVTSVSGTGTVAGLSLSGTVTTTGNLSLSGTLSAPVSSINDSTTVGRNLVKLTDPGSITFLRVNADNTVSALNATDFRTAIGAGTGGGTGTVTSVSGTGTVAGLSLTGTVTTTGNLSLSGTLSAPVSSINDSTTVGRNLVKLADPGAVTFLRVNADNTVSALNATDFRTAIGAGTGGGGVIQVTASAPISSTGGSTPTISIDPATTSAAGSMSAADKAKLNGIEAGAQVNLPTNLGIGERTGLTAAITSSTGTSAILFNATDTLAGLMSAADKAKLNGIQAGATANTGTVTGVTATSPLTSSAGTAPNISLSNAYGDTQNPYASKTSNLILASPNGSAGAPTFRSLVSADIPALDASKITSGTIDAARLPSYIDDVVEAANLAGFPATGETGKIYVALDTNKTYRWSGSTYILITSGAVDSVAGKTGVVTLTKTDVGLGNVDNTSDADKPVSTAQQAALNLKANIDSPNFTGSVKENNNQVLHAGNYSGYSPTLTGGGASGSWSISVTGNASTATTLQTSRTINGVAFNGSQNIVVQDSTKLPLTGGTLTGSVTLNGGSIGIDVAPTDPAVSGRSIQIVNGGGLLWATTGSFVVANNITIDSSGNGVYQLATAASSYSQTAGTHRWYTAAGGTAGSVANMVEGLSLNSTALDSKVAIKENNNQVLHAGNYSNYAIPAVAPGTSGNVLTSNGSSWTSQAPSGGAGNSVNIQEFSTVGTSTWTKPAGAKLIHIILQAGGGGGGSGRVRASASFSTETAGGGGGGGGGGRTEFFFPASLFANTENVEVGAGGSGAASQTSITSGNAGSTGGNSTFGTTVRARARGGVGGNGGSAGAATTGALAGGVTSTGTPSGTFVYSASGGTGYNIGGSGGRGGYNGGGGGGGGGYNSNSSIGGAGGAGGLGGAIIDSSTNSSGGGGAGGASGNPGTAGSNATDPFLGGSGGGGGSGGQPGAAGGIPGGGGGGGGAGSNAVSGAGGNGGHGFVRITTYF